MLLALRSLYETETPPPVVPPIGIGGGGESRPHFPQFPPHRPVSIPGSVTLTPARARFRAGNLTATGGATVEIQPATATFRVSSFPATGAANADLNPAKAKFRAGKLEAFGIQNDEAIAAAILEL